MCGKLLYSTEEMLTPLFEQAIVTPGCIILMHIERKERLTPGFR